MQVLLALEEVQRLVDAVDADVRAAVGLHAVATVVAARRFQAHLGHLVGGEARVGEQEERLAGHGRVAARRNVVVRLHDRGRGGEQAGAGQGSGHAAQRVHRVRKDKR